ncbi:podoplanin [Mastacembelus armatus]|uniref:podoplanin n=1 Tax=Mastacembelus armatus TaxID=205130 RepID=UPI000E461D50|nr:cell wall protein RTB1-like [Mastacembelus armatus]
MNVQLLLLLALVGPFCASTYASPTVHPSVLDVWTTKAAVSVIPETPADEIVTVIPSSPETETFPHTTEAVTVQVSTDSETEAPETEAPETEAPENKAPETEAPETEAPETEAPETEAPDTEATTEPGPLILTVEITSSTEQAKTELQPEVTGAPEAEAVEEVVVEDDAEGGLSSGQVVGIVIGALLAVVIVIAVVIAAVRRMGKYSP